MELEKKKRILTVCGIVAVILILFFGFQIITQQLAVGRGVDYLNEKQYEKAYENFAEAEKKHTIFTSKKNIRYYKGECLIYLGRYEDAASTYENIAQRHHEARAYALQGFALQQDGDQKNALQAYQNAIEADKKDGIGYYYLYAYYVEQNEYEQALDALEDAQNVPVTSMEQEIAFAKIVAYEKLLDYDQALEEAKKYCKNYPDDERGKKEREFLETR